MTEDIQDVSHHDIKARGCTGCQPGTCGGSCSSCSPSCGRSGPSKAFRKIEAGMKDALEMVKSDRPFALPPDSIEITLDLPIPPSINRLWRFGKRRVWKSEEYIAWMSQADMTVMATKKPGRLPKITGPFEARILLNEEMSKADGDNICAKAVLDYCQSRDIIRNDSDCRRGSWEWVEPERAPKGARVILRSLHGADR